MPRPPIASRADRREGLLAWRAVPHRTRVEVLRAAKRGERHPDAGAVDAARRYAQTVVSPTGPHWWQRSSPLASGCIAAVTALVLAGAAVWMLTSGSPTGTSAGPLGWVVLGVAVVFGLCAAFMLDLARETRYLLALPGGWPGADGR